MREGASRRRGGIKTRSPPTHPGAPQSERREQMRKKGGKGIIYEGKKKGGMAITSLNGERN